MGVYGGPDIVEDGLVLCLDAGNIKSYSGSGTTWTDLSGLNNNGTLQNGVGSAANNGGEFVFDGTDDRVLVNCTASTIRTFNSTTQFAVKLPVYSGGQRCILSYRTGAAGNLYIGKLSGSIYCYYNQLNNPGHVAGAISNGSLIVCTVTCDASNNLFGIHINGSLVGRVTRTGWVSSYHNTLYLGWDAGGTNEYMLGNFYHFSHYNKVLSDNEITQNYVALRGRFGI